MIIRPPFYSISFSIIPNASTISYRMRPPPTDEYYDTHDKLFATINRHTRKEGYAVFKKRTKSSNKRGIFRVTF